MTATENHSTSTPNDSGKRTKPEHHARDVFHAWMLEGATYAGPLDMPILKGTDQVPERLIAFSDAMQPGCKDFDCWVHLFEDDSILERFWHNPKAYVGKLSKFRGALGMDYSVSWDFPRAVKDYNHFRNSACSHWLSRQGLEVIPQTRCEDGDYEDVLAGMPRHSTIAIGARSMVRDRDDRAILKASVKHIVDYLEPSFVVWYGSTQYGVADYLDEKNVPYRAFPGKGRGSLSHHVNEDVS